MSVIASADRGGISPLPGAPVRKILSRVCVLVPTRNEAGNVLPLLTRLDPVLSCLGGEVLFVDDSDDETPKVVEAAARRVGVPVRLVHRPPEKRVGGLGGAVQTGLALTAACWTVVMDGDLQHPPEDVPRLVAAGESGADLVVASRYCSGGSADGLSSGFRNAVSASSTALARMLFPRALAHVSDPMSGFFALRTAVINPAVLRPRGFKILLELLARYPGIRVAEVPFTFGERSYGQSKASWREGLLFARQLVALRAATTNQLGRLVRFAAVGGSGMAVNLLVLASFLHAGLGGLGRGGQAIAAVAATQVAIGWNFALSERWVFPGRPGHWVRRIVPFWALNCATLLAQLPLADGLQPILGRSYVLGTAGALSILVLARFMICDKYLYRRGKHRRHSHVRHSDQSASYAATTEMVAITGRQSRSE